jgi:hypothetical protein
MIEAASRLHGVERLIEMEQYFVIQLSDDYQYVRDLGLITDTGRQIIPANPIYSEVIARALTVCGL